MLKYIKVVTLFLVFAAFFSDVVAQQNVVSRGEVSTGNWWDAANPWFRPCDNFNLDRPDKNECDNFLTLGRTNVFIGHDNNNPMNVNGAFFTLRSLTIESGVGIPRSYNASGGGEISLTDGLYNLSGNSQTFNVPIVVDDVTVNFDAEAGNLNFSQNFFLNANTAVFDGANNTFISGHIQGGGGSVVKNGTGVLIFDNSSNNYSGSTAINAGTLRISNNGTAGVLPTAVLNNATLEFSRSNNYTYTNVISGTGQIVKSSSGLLTLTASNTYTGTTTINEGTLRITNSSSLGLPGSGTTVEVGGALELNAGASNYSEPLTLNGDGVSGTGALRKIDSGNSQYNGNISLGSDARINTTAGLLDLRGTIALNNNTLFVGTGTRIEMGSGSELTGASKVGGNGALYKDGSSIFLLRPSTTLTGDIRLVQGTLRIGPETSGIGIPAGGTLFMSSGTTVSSDGSATRVINKNIELDAAQGAYFFTDLSGALTLNGNLNLSGAEQSLSNTYPTTINGVISNGGIWKTGLGQLVLQGVNTYSGVTRVFSGSINLTSSLAIQNSTLLLNTGSGTINFGTPATYTLGGLAGGDGLNMQGKTLAIGNNNSNTTYNGALSNGSLEKIGTGTLNLAGTNTYSGTTTITQGTLELGANNVLSTSSAIVLNGGTLRSIPATGNSTLGTLELAESSTIDLGGTAEQLTFANSSAIPWDSEATLTISGWSGTAEQVGTDSRIFVDDPSGLTEDQLLRFQFTGYDFGAMILTSGSVHEIVPKIQNIKRFDDFNRGQADIVGSPSGGNPGSWSELEEPTTSCPAGTFIEVNSNNQLQLTRGDGGTCSADLNIKMAAFDVSGEYSTILRDAEGLLEWYFNFRQTDTGPSAQNRTAFIIGSTDPDFTSPSASGYAVVMGDQGVTPGDEFKLIHFNGGIPTSNDFDDEEIIGIANPNTTHHYSIRVTFEPCSSEWTMTVRSDGAAGFRDPATIDITDASSIEFSNTDLDLRYIGAYRRHSTTGTRTSFFDNIYIPISPAAANSYVWNVAGDGDYQNSINWTPTRSCGRGGDILRFNSGGSHIVSNVPSEIIGQLIVENNTSVALRDVVDVPDDLPSTLTISGRTTGEDLFVENGSSLIYDTGNNETLNYLVISLASGATAEISGDLDFTKSFSGTTPRHKLLGEDFESVRI
ncbi:MAG: autotransporter-associated beta strand repeat-containing protein, partial [Cryomorphaceae bacterium]